MRCFAKVRLASAAHIVHLTLWAVAGLLLLGAGSATAQHQFDYYRSIYRYGAQINPIGFLLGRPSAEFEWREDPSVSHLINFTYHYDVESPPPDGKKIVQHSFGLGYDHRFYLIDNAAVEGPYASLGAGLEFANNRTVVFRATAHIGWKYLLFGTQFYVSPDCAFDFFTIRGPSMRVMSPYITLPMGIVWK